MKERRDRNSLPHAIKFVCTCVHVFLGSWLRKEQERERGGEGGEEGGRKEREERVWECIQGIGKETP